MKTVGIIGGLGPETTADFYLEIVFRCYEKDKSARPPILIWNIPMDYSIENDLILKAIGEERYIPYLVYAAKKLEKAGADFIVIPCNSVHAFIKEVKTSVKIPVLSIIEETTNFLSKEGVKKAGVLATSSLLNHRLYENSLKAKGIVQELLDKKDQARVNEIINNLVLNQQKGNDKEELLAIIDKFEKKGVEHVILGCTDLQILVPSHDKLKIHDSMKIFVQATVREILK